MQRKYEAAEQCCLKAVDISSKTHGNKSYDLRAYGELALSVVEDQWGRKWSSASNIAIKGKLSSKVWHVIATPTTDKKQSNLIWFHTSCKISCSSVTRSCSIQDSWKKLETSCVQFSGNLRMQHFRLACSPFSMRNGGHETSTWRVTVSSGLTSGRMLSLALDTSQWANR